MAYDKKRRDYYFLGVAVGRWGIAIGYIFGIARIGRPRQGKFIGISMTRYDGQPSIADPCGEMRGTLWNVFGKKIYRATAIQGW